MNQGSSILCQDYQWCITGWLFICNLSHWKQQFDMPIISRRHSHFTKCWHLPLMAFLEAPLIQIFLHDKLVVRNIFLLTTKW